MIEQARGVAAGVSSNRLVELFFLLSLFSSSTCSIGKMLVGIHFVHEGIEEYSTSTRGIPVGINTA